MKNKIYLTQQAKEEIEAKIAELDMETHGSKIYKFYKSGAISVLKSILSSATILPVEESWDKVHEHCYTDFQNHKKHENEDYLCTEEKYFKKSFPHGVIIQPKK